SKLTLPGSPAHLFRRFFDVASAKPLTQSEREAVRSWLEPELADVFFEQRPADQRHGYHAALVVVAAGSSERDVLVAALLHDVGKRHARLGVFGRSLASLLILVGSPLGDRMRAYRDHGLNGAGELARLGAPALAIDFAMHHHGRRPPTIDPATWRLLVEADQPPKARSRRRGRITSAVR
ncbi:MAG TPA: hypothetical protein VFT85_06195, partial [Acidimicrobiia bacterium]|nr:hypothetical protein [Acidimicrobiia bacterium]